MKRLSEFLIYLYLILFPFGQLIGIRMSFFGFKLPVYPTDVTVGAIFLINLIKKEKKTYIMKSFNSLLVVLLFSLLFSLSIFNLNELLPGIIYLIRLVAYSGLFFGVIDFAKDSEKKSRLLNLLIVSAFFSGVLGWVQYILFPDLTALKYVGWDDHAYRIVGSFLDPTFLAIILTFGAIISMVDYIYKKDNRIVPLIIFFLITLAFTYARAAYIALAIAIVVLSIIRKKKAFLAILFVFILLLPFLPRPESEGVKLERMHSVYLKLDNYKQTWHIFLKNPIFGIGYNNICNYKVKFFGDSIYSHSCSGSDSSVLLILATTGIVGVSVFSYLIRDILFSLSKGAYKDMFVVNLAALLIHSLFVNSLFYPWVMGFMLVLAGISYNLGSKR